MKKFINTVLAGFYIGLGATVYFLIEDKVIASLFFTTGIFLVMNFYNMLFTRVVPLLTQRDYTWADAGITIVGNTIGGLICAILVGATRLNAKIDAKILPLVETKLSDSISSLFIMGILCAVLVAYAVFCSKYYAEKKGVAIFFYLLFVAAFVICGFEHIVANGFYFSMYAVNHGFDARMIPAFLTVLAGNIVGGLGVGYLETYRLKKA